MAMVSTSSERDSLHQSLFSSEVNCQRQAVRKMEKSSFLSLKDDFVSGHFDFFFHLPSISMRSFDTVLTPFHPCNTSTPQYILGFLEVRTRNGIK